MSDVQEHPLYKRAMECQTAELDLYGESMCLCRVRCRAVRLSFRLACSWSVGGVCVCARTCGVEGVGGALGC
eukprot:COSAG02_NODE_13224_length_1423_cov_4.558157_3_plen_72_part_00